MRPAWWVILTMTVASACTLEPTSPIAEASQGYSNIPPLYYVTVKTGAPLYRVHPVRGNLYRIEEPWPQGGHFIQWGIASDYALLLPFDPDPQFAPAGAMAWVHLSDIQSQDGAVDDYSIWYQETRFNSCPSYTFAGTTGRLRFRQTTSLEWMRTRGAIGPFIVAQDATGELSLVSNSCSKQVRPWKRDRSYRSCAEFNQQRSASGYFTVDTLRAMVQSGSYGSIDELWQGLHKQQKSGEEAFGADSFPALYAAVYRSRSLQRAGTGLGDQQPWPRIIASNALGDLLIAIEGKSHVATEQDPEPQTMEVMAFRCEPGQIGSEPALVVETPEGLKWLEPTANAPDWLVKKARATSPDVTVRSVCSQCHGERMHPNIDGYPFWPGWIGSHDRGLTDFPSMLGEAAIMRHIAERLDVGDAGAARFKPVFGDDRMRYFMLMAQGTDGEEFLPDAREQRHVLGLGGQLDALTSLQYRLNGLRVADTIIQRMNSAYPEPAQQMLILTLLYEVLSTFTLSNPIHPKYQPLLAPFDLSEGQLAQTQRRIDAGSDGFVGLFKLALDSFPTQIVKSSRHTISAELDAVRSDLSQIHPQRLLILEQLGLAPETWSPTLQPPGAVVYRLNPGEALEIDLIWPALEHHFDYGLPARAPSP
ncbi:MAG: hypothetical protein H6715_05505 [Myxococcales bacterium]|nr:hypothetical protein [Myxococcales bacterium]